MSLVFIVTVLIPLIAKTLEISLPWQNLSSSFSSFYRALIKTEVDHMELVPTSSNVSHVYPEGRTWAETMINGLKPSMDCASVGAKLLESWLFNGEPYTVMIHEIIPT